MLAAELLGTARYAVLQLEGVTLLRDLGCLIGAANLALTYIGLRLIFPGETKKPLAGLALGAFLPAQLYLLYYPTNETLAAMFATGALVIALHLLRAPKAKWEWHAALGVTLGLALASKASALLVLVAVLGALAARLIMRGERRPSAWLDVIGAPLLICVTLSGWHYWKLWRDFGNPLIGNWNPKVAGGWWQAKGYLTPGYFLGFGQALTHPFLSGMHSFWDGFYTTLWGDGLCGGRNDFLEPASLEL